ncbi:hypothetical protein PoB_002990600 [Plakobranchus ocellatus]|uniref:Uncharacterized protein n=1 Tax=Plakobranchus ocellatus TaxID=259542 RepID=A0AAV3ZWR6_9GAST|nr:hypothetical protein PoB_002990600 [Plakobranchus ocellatus]
MKVWSVLALTIIAATISISSSQAAAGPTAASSNVAVDPFILLVREIESSAFFPQLDMAQRVLTFEILAAAETQNLELLFNKIGYIIRPVTKRLAISSEQKQGKSSSSKHCRRHQGISIAFVCLPLYTIVRFNCHTGKTSDIAGVRCRYDSLHAVKLL